MNKDGIVVGVATDSDGLRRGFYCLAPYEASGDLNSSRNRPAGWHITAAVHINDVGQISGNYRCIDADGTARDHVFVYYLLTDQFDSLPQPDGLPWSYASGINNLGEITGELQDEGATPDPVAVAAAGAALAYADPADQRHPHVSPVYGDFSKGFAPTLIQGGTRELFLSHFVRLYRAIDAARHLGFASMSCHTPADNSVNRFVQNLIDGESPRTLDDLVKLLHSVPEYADAATKGYGPILIQGTGSKRCGSCLVDMTGGTEGPKEALDKLVAAGVDTLVGMHYSEEHKKHAEELKLNLVIAGHVSSDALGMNLVLDHIESQGVEVICTSGMVRVKRS